MSGKSSSFRLYVTVSVADTTDVNPTLCANVIVFPFSTVCVPAAGVTVSDMIKLVTGCVPAVTAVI